MFLDPNIAKDFRKVINSSEIFRKSAKLKEKFNLICVVMDRIDSAITYLNRNSNIPNAEEDFICFLVYACMVKDGVSKLYESVYQNKPRYATQKKHFSDIKQYGNFKINDENCPTDDMFFEYLRSMAFAHPFQTDKRKRPFIDEGEKQYCPWVIARDGYVGIRVYTSSDKFIIEDLTFSFENIKEYVKDRYECLKELTVWAEQEIIEQNDVWSQNRVKRSEDVFETIESIKEIMRERFYQTYNIDEIERYLKCDISVPENIENINTYRDALRKSVNKICDALDSVDECDLASATDGIFAIPRNVHSMLHYQMEKIMCYLNDDCDYWDQHWGLVQAEAFSKEFAKKWFVFNFEKMSYDEIQLTVAAACYLEAMDQDQKNVS